MIDLVGETANCGPDCPAFIEKWSAWWAEKTREPVAMLECVDIDTYLREIGSKSRNMVKKASRLYEYRRIQYNDHLGGIGSVARSKPIRQGAPMQGWYTQRPKATQPARLCALHADEWYAGFVRGSDHMVAFARLEVLGQLGIINSILGDPKAGAVVNGLVAHLVEYAGVHWINYLHPEARTQTLGDFKRRVGFRPMVVPASPSPAEVRS